ncbi:MAG: class I adenylate-forming enzyme family protein [Aliishimia sp.]
MGGDHYALLQVDRAAARRGLRTMTAMTLQQAVEHVTTTNPTFAMTTATIRGVEFRVFENIPQTVGSLLRASWAPMGEGAAEYLVFDDERWTFSEFCDDVKAMAHVLQHDLGVNQGDRVAIAMRNYPELMVLMMAITSVGAVIVFVNAWWTTEELDYALRDSAPSLVFADGPRAERIAPLIEPLNLTVVGVRDGEVTADKSYTSLRDSAKGADWPDVSVDNDDDFAVMYSSGTTGRPKGVVLTHRGAVNAVFSWLMQAVIAPLMDPPAPDAPEAARPSVLVATPLFHVTATHPVFLLSLPAGAKVALIPKWDPENAAQIIQDHKITRLLGVPTQSADLMQTAKRLGLTLPTLDYVGAGGAKRPPVQVAQLAETFPNANIATGWGMTETNALGIGMIGQEYVDRPDAAGRLHPPLQEIKLLDEDGAEVPMGEPGEITVKSPSNMRCYLNKPDATAEVLQDGWLRTGDMGVIDAEGYVTIVDRKKNIIIRGGENIACLDVEAAIHRHPDVIEACAFSVPDERLGEIVGASIHLRDGANLDSDAMRAFLDGHLAHFKIPNHLWFQTDALPRGATDKLDRRGVRTACLETL